MTPPADRPRFYNARAKARRVFAFVYNEGRLAYTLARRAWLGIVRGPGRVLAHPVLRRIVLGLPAAAVAGAAVTVLALNPRADQNKFRSRYRVDAERALSAGQWEEARVRYQRLAVDAGYPPDDVYGLARALEGAGHGSEAESLYIRVAPDGATGHPEAHFRRAVQLLAEKPPQVARAEAHLLRAINARPDYPEAHSQLGQLYLAAHRPDEAAKHLLVAVNNYPGLSLPLAIIYKGRDRDACARWAAAAVEHFGQAARIHPDDATSVYRYALGLKLAERYRESADVVRTSLAKKDDPALRELAGDVYADWCLTIIGEGRDDERLRRIEEGLQINPGAGRLLLGLATTAFGNGPPAMTARVTANRMIDAGGPTAVAVRFAFGIESARRGDIVGARHFLSDAYRDDPKSLLVANNLACLLNRDPSPDPARALAILDAALRDHADNPVLRDSRGQIFIRLARWQDAVRDLEFALPRIPPNRDTHLALADAYRHMNLTSLAEAHVRKASELKQ